MHFTQRAFTYLARKKGKTISLFLLICIVALFLISCFGVLHGSEKLERDIRTSLGAAFYIRADTQVSMTENGEAEVTENPVHITRKDIDMIMQTGEIRYCNPINYGFAKSDSIEFIPGDKHTAENNMGKVTALRFSALASSFLDKKAILTEGKHITETDKGRILISEELARANHLSVGDTLTLTHAELGESDDAYTDEIPVKTAYIQAQVAGIYKLDRKSNSVKPTACLAENEIYASLDILNELHESEPDVYTGEVDFYITDPAGLNSITRNIRQIQSIDWTTHFIRTNDFQYSKIAGKVSSLGDLVKILLVLVSVVSGTVLTLLLTMRMRSRMQEAGILLSIGIAKRQIIAGFLLEVWFVSVPALLVSYAASYGVTDFLGHNLFRGLMPDLVNDAALTAGVHHPVSIENYLKPGGAETALIYLCQFLVITASVFVSSIGIMRLTPKEILSKIN